MSTVTIGKLEFLVAPKVGEVTLDELLKKHHHPHCPFVNDGHWTFEVLTDSTTLPSGASEIVRQAEEEGVQVEWVVAHEVAYKPVTLPEWHITEEDEETIKKVALGVAVAGAVVVLAPVVLAGVALMAVACSSGDPVLLACWIDKKGVKRWTNCYRWYAEG